MKISKFLLGALLSIVGLSCSQAVAFDGIANASDGRIAAQQPRQQQQQYIQVSYNEYNAMENRLANLETKLASFDNSDMSKAANGCTSCGNSCTACGSGCTACGGCGGCCDGCCGCNCCNWLNTQSGVFAEAQALYLKAYESEADDAGERYETGSRYTFGFMGNCGSSLRVRYFEYTSTLDAGARNVQLEYIDTEYAARFCLGNLLRGELSAGTRWAQYDEEGENKYSDSLGLLLGLHVRGPSIHCWDTFVTVRYSQQFGHTNNNTGPAPTEEDGTFGIMETQIGLTRDFCCHCTNGFISVFAETQNWSGVFLDDSQDLGLAGIGASIGIRR